MTRHRPHRPRPSPFFKLPVGFAFKRGGIICPYCRKQFENGHQVSGHLAYCQAAHAYMSGRLPLNHNPILVLEEEDFNVYVANMNADFQHDDWESDEVVHPPVENEYYDQQMLCLSKESVEFKTGYCLTSSGNWEKSKWNHYLAICKTIEQCAVMTAGEADTILSLIKYLCADNGHSIALPVEYRQMIKTVLASTKHRRLTTIKQWISPPLFYLKEEMSD
jgi:hypothetical protein